MKSHLLVNVSQPGSNLVFLQGHLTHLTYHQFNTDARKYLPDTGPFIIDCYELKSIDAVGLGAIITLAICLQHGGRTLHLENVNNQPRKLLKALDLCSLLVENTQCLGQLDLQNA